MSFTSTDRTMCTNLKSSLKRTDLLQRCSNVTVSFCAVWIRIWNRKKNAWSSSNDETTKRLVNRSQLTSRIVSSFGQRGVRARLTFTSLVRPFSFLTPSSENVSHVSKCRARSTTTTIMMIEDDDDDDWICSEWHFYHHWSRITFIRICLSFGCTALYIYLYTSVYCTF